MTDYTPTTEVIRHAVAFPRERLGEPRPIKPEAFDRWLGQVKAEAWEEGYRQPLPTRKQIATAIYDVLNSQYGDFCIPDDAADAVLALLKGQTDD